MKKFGGVTLKIRKSHVILFLLIGAGLAACGGPSAGSGSSAAGSSPTSAPIPTQKVTDACALVTEQEATAALGADPGVGKSQGRAGAGQKCTYQGAGGIFLSVGINPLVTRAQFDDGKQKTKDNYQAQGGGTVQDISGIGDTAFVASSDHGGACEFLKGTLLGGVTIISPAVMTSPAAVLTSLCRTLVGRV